MHRWVQQYLHMLSRQCHSAGNRGDSSTGRSHRRWRTPGCKGWPHTRWHLPGHRHRDNSIQVYWQVYYSLIDHLDTKPPCGNGSPCHTAKTVLEWPPNSKGLNPIEQQWIVLEQVWSMEGLIHLETYRTQRVQSKVKWGLHGSNLFGNFPPNLDWIGIWGIWRPGRCLELLVTFFWAFLSSSCSSTVRIANQGAYLVWVGPRTTYHAVLQKLFWNVHQFPGGRNSRRSYVHAWMGQSQIQATTGRPWFELV